VAEQVLPKIQRKMISRKGAEDNEMLRSGRESDLHGWNKRDEKLLVELNGKLSQTTNTNEIAALEEEKSMITKRIKG
jgi:hypothetical protein|tara:strand:+ start:594 stop:824 length:231 start_codon:yes stop_codon:yes gene_type:complete